MYTVTKQFEFCYAHRLHGYPGQCGSIHGHTARVEISCQVTKLPESGMAVDFRDLSKKIGNWIDENLDHRLILAQDDPIVPKIKEAGEDVRELGNPPSAENLARLIYEAAQEFGLPVVRVTFWESPTSAATYEVQL